MTAKTYPMRCSVRAQADVTRVDIFDDIGPGGFFGDGLTAKDFAASLSGISGPLEVHLNSGGGDVGDGLAISSAIRAHKGFKRTVVDGIAASIASVIFQAGDERVIEPGGMLMVHDPFTSAVGNAAELRQLADTLDKHGDNIADQYARRSGKPADYWRDVMKAETWFKADEAVAAGLADKVGPGAAELPAGLDLAVFDVLPGRVAAALRSMPQAAAPVPDGAPSAPKCRTCKGRGRLPHPVTGAKSMNCPSCKGKGTYSADAAQDRLRNADGPKELGNGWVEDPDGTRRFDPDGDGDDDSTPEGDTDHDYFAPDGTPIKPIPPCPQDALTEERVRAILREEVARAAAGVFAAEKVDSSPWDASRAWHNGTQADDPEAFYRGICAGHHTSGDPKTQAYWALPYRYAPDGPPNAGGVRAAWAVLNGAMGGVKDLADRDAVEAKVKGLMKQVNPDWSPDDSTTKDVSGGSLEQIRAALKGAR